MCSKARAGASRSSQETPFVSVVTPFYNTEEYLSECIESVLNQTYENFEYILLDNCSTDGSRAIAESYARGDSRIRLLSNDELLSQVENYNRALRQVDRGSDYVKMSQADDFLYPRCLERMVSLAHRHPGVGLVSACIQKEDGRVDGRRIAVEGVIENEAVFPGAEIGRGHLAGKYFLFGSPTAVLYRADFVRRRPNFFDPTVLAEDTDACYRVLSSAKFGFVNEVLTFCRTENEGIYSSIERYAPAVQEGYLFSLRYAHAFFPYEEAQQIQANWENRYYRLLGESLLQLRGGDFWQWHQTGLETMGESVDRLRVLSEAVRRLASALRRPKKAIERGVV